MPFAEASLQAVYDYVDLHQQRFIDELRELVRQPSISAENWGVRECAELVQRRMEELGIATRLLPSATQPFVYGELGSPGASRTLLVTSHYDVHPIEPRAAWADDPFSGDLRNGNILGRGAADAKGNLMAGLKAVEALLRTAGGVPVNLKFLFDGDDECGSRSLETFVAEHRGLLAADDLLELDGGFTVNDHSAIHLSNCGTLYLELRCKTLGRDGVTLWAQLLPSAAWRLLWAISTLKDPRERILIDGFYDDVLPPTAEERAYVSAYPWKDEDFQARFGISGFLGDVRGLEAQERLYFEPSLSLCAFSAGTTGAGITSAIPAVATARLNVQLMPDQRPQDIVDKLRAHLARGGFGDVEVIVQSAIEPALTPPDSEIAQAVLRAAPRVGIDAYLKPRTYEHGKLWSWLARRLGIRGAALVGIAQPVRNTHRQDEYLDARYFINGIKYVASIWREYAR